MSKIKLPRLAIVISHPTQYYSPWFRTLSNAEDLDLKVFYLWDFGVRESQDPRFKRTFQWDIDLTSGYKNEFIKNVSPDPGTNRFSGLNNPELIDRLKAYAPEVVLVYGYRYRTHLRLILGARKYPWRLFFRGDSHLLDQRRPAWLKRTLLKFLYGKFDQVLYVGQANRAYFKSFGIPDNRLTFAPHSVDAERFSHPISSTEIAAERHQLGATRNTRIILFSGKFHPEKAPLTLLRAFAHLKNHDDALLVFAGDGEQRDLLVAETKKRRMDKVKFLPFANQSEMPLRYAVADLFVLPSEGLYETWGLAVNEAMHQGIPCIVSNRVGCQTDLITDGETGWVFRAGDEAELTHKLSSALSVLAEDTARRSLQNNIRHRIAQYTYTQTSAGLRSALQSLLEESA